MSERSKDFVPAAGTDWLLPFYDPVDHLLRGGRAKEGLLRQARIPAGARVLDVGCGTGTLAILTKRQHPGAMVVGVDPDPKALAVAQRKAARRGVEVTFDQGYCQGLPYPDGHFDVVLSSMMLHHLSRDVKRAMFREVSRVLAPSGHFHAMDFGPPRGPFSRLVARLMRGHASIADNLEGHLPQLMREAGLCSVDETGSVTRLIGSLAYYKAAAA
jgi:ubiquinone/menaquinone biosynthesis C-methylase UbiE